MDKQPSTSKRPDQDELYSEEVMGIFTLEMYDTQGPNTCKSDDNTTPTYKPLNLKTNNNGLSAEFARQFLTPPPPHSSPRKEDTSPTATSKLTHTEPIRKAKADAAAKAEKVKAEAAEAKEDSKYTQEEDFMIQMFTPDWI